MRSRRRRGGRRMDLGKRVEMKGAAAASREQQQQQQGGEEQGEREFEEMLLREHSVSTDMGSLDWKRMKIPPVLTSSQSARLFKTMQPMKVPPPLVHSIQIANETIITVIVQTKQNKTIQFHSGDLRSAGELARGAAEGPHRRGGRRGHRHDRPPAPPPPRRRPGRQEQAH